MFFFLAMAPVVVDVEIVFRDLLELVVPVEWWFVDFIGLLLGQFFVVGNHESGIAMRALAGATLHRRGAIELVAVGAEKHDQVAARGSRVVVGADSLGRQRSAIRGALPAEAAVLPDATLRTPDDDAAAATSALGTTKVAPHLGHLPTLPARSSGQLSRCPWGQRNSIISECVI